jgi:hypothetical protein
VDGAGATRFAKKINNIIRGKVIEWRPVVGYEGHYEVSSDGRVRSIKKLTRGYVMDERSDRGGYMTVRLNKDDRKSSTQFVHRLIAKAFIPNPDPADRPFVNHKNGNKLDNRIHNLEWVSHSETMKHAYAHGLVRKPQVKQVWDNCTGELYESVKATAAALKINVHTLRNYLNGGIATNPTCLEFVERAAC